MQDVLRGAVLHICREAVIMKLHIRWSVNNGVEATIRNIGRLGRDGMRQTDKEIVRIMLDGDKKQ